MVNFEWNSNNSLHSDSMGCAAWETADILTKREPDIRCNQPSTLMSAQDQVDCHKGTPFDLRELTQDTKKVFSHST